MGVPLSRRRAAHHTTLTSVTGRLKMAAFAEVVMLRRAIVSILSLILVATSSLLAQKTLTATEAKDHIGEQGTVCGKVVSTRYAESSRGSPTFLNFDQPYPNQVFTLLIWGSDRSKFDDPEALYRGKRICVAGKITNYKGVPEIVANDPSQVKMQKPQ